MSESHSRPLQPEKATSCRSLILSTQQGTREEVLHAWTQADGHFSQCRSETERGPVMVAQLRCREIVERISDLAAKLSPELRCALVDEGVWSVEEGLDGCRELDFVTRHETMRLLVGSLPDELLDRAFALVSSPQPGDAAAWFVDADLMLALLERLTVSQRYDRVLEGLRALPARRAEVMRRLSAQLPASALRRAIDETIEAIGSLEASVALMEWCEILPLLNEERKSGALAEARRLAGMIPASDWASSWGDAPSTRIAVACAEAGLWQPSEIECVRLKKWEDVLVVANKHPEPSRSRLAGSTFGLLEGRRGRMDLNPAPWMAELVSISPQFAPECFSWAQDTPDLSYRLHCFCRLTDTAPEPIRSRSFHAALSLLADIRQTPGDVRPLANLVEWAHQHSEMMDEAEFEALAEADAELADEVATLPRLETPLHRLARAVLGSAAEEADILEAQSFGKVLDHVEHHLERVDVPAVAELSMRISSHHGETLRRALLASGKELWKLDCFSSLFDPSQRREHLCAVVRECWRTSNAWLLNTLLWATKVVTGERRRALIDLAAAQTRQYSSGRTWRLAELAALAEGDQRKALVAEIESAIESLDTDARLMVSIRLLEGAGDIDAARFVAWGLAWVATGEPSPHAVYDFLAAIPAQIWERLAESAWWPVMAATASEEMDLPCDPAILNMSSLPQAVRGIVAARVIPRWLEATPDQRLDALDEILPGCEGWRDQVIEAAFTAPVELWREHERLARDIARYLGEAELGKLEDVLDVEHCEVDDATHAALAEAWARIGRLDCAERRRMYIKGEDERAAVNVTMALAAPARSLVLDALEPFLSGVRQGDALLRAARTIKGTSDGSHLAALVRRAPSASDRLQAWSELLAPLAEAERAAFLPEVARAVDEVLSKDGSDDDDSLWVIMPILPTEVIGHIWARRASAKSWRRTVVPDDQHLFAYMTSEHYLHPDRVLSTMLRLGGERAIVDLARMLVEVDASFSRASEA